MLVEVKLDGKPQPEDDSFVQSKHVVGLNEKQKVTFTSL
jgi:hypothetical protein